MGIGPQYVVTVPNALPDVNNSTLSLSSTWSFQEDPTNIGITDGWFEPGFDVSGWSTILSGRSWESQIGLYSGYGWYVQTVQLNLPFEGNWVQIDIGGINGDLIVWWNGTIIGTRTGQYNYKNWDIPVYYLEPSQVLNSNTVAIRCWGGNLDDLTNSGLANTPVLSLASLSPLWARPNGGTLSQEIPLGAYDLSSAQNGAAFEIVLRINPVQLIGLSNPYITYSLLSLYDGAVITSGLAAITLGSDGIDRSIIVVSGQAAVNVYLSGNASVKWNVINYVPGPMTDTGMQLVVNTGGGTSYTMEIWSQTWAAGTVTLPPDGSSANHGVYIPIIPAPVILSDLVVNDNLSVGGIPDSTYWSFESNLQIGSLVSGDRTFTIQTLPSLVTGAQFIQTSQNSKFFGGNPPLQAPMATFVVDRTTTIYLAIDVRVIPALWEPSGVILTVVQTPSTTITFNMAFYGQFVSGPATIVLPPDGNPDAHSMYFVSIVDPTVVISDLIVYDDLTDVDNAGASTTDAALWSINTNLQAGNLINQDRTYTFKTMPTYFAGSQWIQTAQNSKNYGGQPLGIGPMAQFNVDRACWVWLVCDTRTGVPGGITTSNKQLSFAARDAMQLPALSPVTYVNTPLGNLQLIDQVICSTPTISETHPYMQGGFGGGHLEDFNTPGSTVSVTTPTILGQPCRAVDYGFYAYRLGAGGLIPRNMYVVAVTYPEDVPRYVQFEIQAGQDYVDVGWKNGLANNIYDPWPLSGTWQTFYQIFTVDEETTATHGTEDGNGVNGVWIYILGKVSLPNSYWSIYTDGSAIGTISLYAIDPVANAPVINYPVGLPQRIMTFDFERPPTQPPVDICNYANLMGYNTVSPLVGMKWGTEHFAPPLAGYNTSGVDPEGYLWGSSYVIGSGNPSPNFFPGTPSWHEQFLTATAAAGLNYIPRFEYGGSYDLPQAAWSINAAGTFAQPNRYNSLPVAGGAGANLVHPAVTTELQAFFASFVEPYTSYSNFKGLYWRLRRDTMQISYGANDIAAFTAATGNIPPSGLNAAQLAMWASTGSIQPLYASWWHGVRAAFHYNLLAMLQAYRSDLIMLYFNWDVDKWSMLAPDLNSAAFYANLAGHGAAVAYGNDLAARVADTAAEYISALETGFFSGAVATKRPDALWPDYGIIPSLYTTPGFRVFCPVNYNAYALPDYINYFQTADGVAVSHSVSYDEIAAREPNPKYEGSMMIPGGGSLSMALETMSWAASDVNTLTFTTYTFGRGFADYHRAFAQAFLALPDIPSSTPGGMPANITVRTYVSGTNTYIGVANTATVAQAVSFNIPGSWTPGLAVTDLVANTTVLTATVGGALPMSLMMAPMQLSAFLAVPATLPPPPSGITWVPVGQCIT